MDILKQAFIWTLLLIKFRVTLGCHGYNGLHPTTCDYGGYGGCAVTMRYLKLIKSWTIFHKCLHKIHLTELEDLIIKHDTLLHEILHVKWSDIEIFNRAVDGTTSCEYMPGICKNFKSCAVKYWDKGNKKFEDLNSSDIRKLKSPRPLKGISGLGRLSRLSFRSLLKKFQSHIKYSSGSGSDSESPKYSSYSSSSSSSKSTSRSYVAKRYPVSSKSMSHDFGSSGS